SVCEAMMTGVPVVGLATTEMVVTVKNDYSGYVHTDVDFLIEKMQMLLDNPGKARELGRGAQQAANERFNIERFKRDWLNTFETEVKRASANKNRLYKVA
ncbi:MAG: glycosyl transferase group 1, partial [Segetibacter sp.]|nr:glycosyl transferase group 1 [Segetibacter sp.]